MTAMLPVLLQLVAFVAYLRKSPSSGTSSLVVPLRKQLEVFTGLSSLMLPSSLGATSASNFNPFLSNNLSYYSDISETCCFNNFHYLKLQPTSLGCALLIQNAEPKHHWADRYHEPHAARSHSFNGMLWHQGLTHKVLLYMQYEAIRMIQDRRRVGFGGSVTCDCHS